MDNTQNNISAMNTDYINPDADELVARNLGLVKMEATRRILSAPVADEADRDAWFDEMVQAAHLGLRRAAEKFNPSLGFKFSTYAMPWIRKMAGESFRDLCDTWNHVSLDAPVGDDASDASLVDFVADEAAEDPSEGAGRAMRAEWARALVAALPLRERRVVSLYFGMEGLKPRTFQEIADAENVSAQCIHRIYQRALRRLRKSLPPAA